MFHVYIDSVFHTSWSTFDTVGDEEHGALVREAGVEVAEEDGDTLARPYRNTSSWAPTSLTH